MRAGKSSKNNAARARNVRGKKTHGKGKEQSGENEFIKPGRFDHLMEDNSEKSSLQKMHEKVQMQVYKNEEASDGEKNEEGSREFTLKESKTSKLKHKNDDLNFSNRGLYPNEYIIKLNDTFGELENRLGIEHGTLTKLNPQLDPKNLKPGQKIYIESVQVSPLKFFAALSLKINLGRMGYTNDEIALRLNAFINDHSINDITMVGDLYGQVVEIGMDFIRHFEEISGHTFLDAGGMIPGLGEVFDVANGVWYYIEGDSTNGALSISAAVPFLGWSATAGKWGYKAFKSFGKHGDELFAISKKIERISKHLDYKHLRAAYNDKLGKYIVIGGRAFGHYDEVKSVLRGLKKQIVKIENLINSGRLSQGALYKAVEMRSSAQNSYDAMNKYLKSAENKLP